MPCYKPLDCYAAPGGIAFTRSDSFGIAMQIPCGRCLGCRLDKSKQWALRCVHEAHMHGDQNCFLTLTYNDENLPRSGSLVKTHFPKFIRALRKSTKRKIRYYMCGEYGEKNNRPHYHALLFGYKFPDATFWTVRNGHRIYRSELLEGKWTHGNSEIGSVTFQSAGYVARYILKKQNGERAKEKYGYADPETGELLMREPEYTNMSLKPGIGETFFHKYKTDMFPHDYCITPDGRKTPVPTYYRELLARHDPALAETLRRSRIDKSKQNPDNTPDRLAAREICQQAKADRLVRTL